jgi:hypothetical protein
MQPFIEPRVSPRSFWPAAVADEILRRIAKGDPLAVICAEDGFPTRQTFHRWLVEDPLLSSRYADAVRQSVVTRVTK